MKKINRWLWAIFGIIFSFSAAMMMIGGSFSLDCFYDQGKISEVNGTELGLEGYNLVYANEGDRYFTITDDVAAKDYRFYGRKWNYLLFQVSDLSTPELPATVAYFNLQGVQKGEQQIVLKEGWNVIEPVKKKFGVVRLTFLNCKGEHLSVDAAITRTELSKFSGKKLICYGGLFLLLYCGISAIIAWCLKKHGGNKKKNYAIGCMDFYLKILEILYSKMQCIPTIRLSEKNRKYLRVLCILAEILYTITAVNIDRMKVRYGISLGFHILFLLVLAILMVEPGKKKLQWNTKLCYIWGLLCITICVSDIMVKKVFAGVGVVYLLVFGIFFYCWRRMEKPEQLLQEIGIALQISFVFVLLFCIVCRPFVEGIRYAGCFINPNPFGRYLATVSVAALVQIEWQVRNGLLNWKKAILYGIELDWLFYFIYKSQCRGALLAMALFLLLFLIRSIKMKVSVGMVRDYIRIIVVWLVGFFPVTMTTEWLLYNLPYLLYTQVQWEKDILYMREVTWIRNPFLEEVYASVSRMRESLQTRNLDALSSGRITYWKAHLRNLNLWGHEFRCKINGGGHSAHNMFLDIAYRYGIVVLGMYTVFWGTLLKEVWVSISSKKCYSFMAVACIVSYFMMALLDTIEQPWVYIQWALAYMCVGYYLFKEETNDIIC